MSNLKDFVIEDGVIKKYVGPGGDVVIPDGVTTIGCFAFEESVFIPKLILSNSITEIEEQAFARSQVERVYIPQVKTIGTGAFVDSTQLVEVMLGDGVEEILDAAFSNCRNLSKIVFSKQLKLIDYHAFDGCTSLKNVEFPESLKHIGECAFGKCSSLESVTLPQNIEVIENGAFSQCWQISSLICTDAGLRLFLDSYNAKNLFDVTYKILSERLKTTASVDEKFVGYIKKNHKKIFPIIAESDNLVAFSNFVKYAPPIDKKTITEYKKIVQEFPYAEKVMVALEEYDKTHKLN